MNILTKILLVLFTHTLFAYETGPNSTVLRVPDSGGRPVYGAVNLSLSPSHSGVLDVQSGGRGSFPNEITNLALSTSVGASALTVNLIGQNASTPSSTNPVYIGFRNSTTATGTYNQRSVTSALSIVVPSSATLGMASATATYLYVYALDNAGTVGLGISQMKFDDGSTQAATAVSSGSTSSAVLYTSLSSATYPIRLIGRLLITEATAGTWASNSTEISVPPFDPQRVVAVYTASGKSYDDTDKIIDFATKVIDTNNTVTTGSSWVFTCPKAGNYLVASSILSSNSISTSAQQSSLSLYKNGSIYAVLGSRNYANALSGVLDANSGSAIVALSVGDTINIRGKTGGGGWTTNASGTIVSITLLN